MSEIDVSMCCHYWAGGCEEGGITKKCSDRNCYYKQLQQLKVENEFKESQINDWIKQYKLAHQKYMKLQTENEKLKEQIKSNNFGMFNIQMAQCLDEIEEIIKFEDCLNCPSLEPCGFTEKNCNDFKIETISKLIKQVKEGGE